MHPTKCHARLFLFIFVGIIFSYTTSLVVASTNYKGEEFCANCHLQEYKTWNQTKHVQSFNDPVFQEKWKEQGSPEACLNCHTTGFELETGEFEFDHIGCEMCHGPGGEMKLNTSSSYCSRCHSFSLYPTYNEWLQSEHGHEGVECNACHDPMSLKIKTENPSDICKSCHGYVAQAYHELEHGVEGYDCIDCHMVSKSPLFETDTAGITGHTFYPGVPDPTCLGCHDIDIEKHDTWGTESENCIICHDETYMTRLHLLNGTDVVVTDSSLICAQCHYDIYYEWGLGLHSNTHEIDKTCTDCHSPMRPYIMLNATLPPINGDEQETLIVKPLIPPVLFFGLVTIAIGGLSFNLVRKVT